MSIAPLRMRSSLFFFKKGLIGSGYGFRFGQIWEKGFHKDCHFVPLKKDLIGSKIFKKGNLYREAYLKYGHLFEIV